MSRPAVGRWPRAAAAGLALRAETDADLPFLRRLYASTRAQELAVTGWAAEQTAAFLAMQFDAQRRHYRAHSPDAEWWVVLADGTEAGRIYHLHRTAAEDRLMDIALLPEHRGRGLGSALLADLMAEAAAAGRPLSLYVETFNPAQRLYRRLGFGRVEAQGVYDRLRWPAPEPEPEVEPGVAPGTPQPNTAS